MNIEELGIKNTIREMIRSLCNTDVWYDFNPQPVPKCLRDCVSVLTSSGAPVYNDPIQCLSDCPVTIIPDTNTITSPNYPENYPDDTIIYYVMTAPAGVII